MSDGIDIDKILNEIMEDEELSMALNTVQQIFDEKIRKSGITDSKDYDGWINGIHSEIKEDGIHAISIAIALLTTDC